MKGARRRVKEVKGKVGPIAVMIILLLGLLLFLTVLRVSVFSHVNPDKRVWLEITFLLTIAILAEYLVVHLKQPTVMALLLLGVLASPHTIKVVWPYAVSVMNSILPFFTSYKLSGNIPNLVSSQGVVSVFAQLGAIILLFKIGLDSKVNQIFNLRNFMVGLAGVIVPFVCGYYFASLTGHSFAYSLFLGAALTATSVGVTIAVLQELKVLIKEFAKVIIGAAVIDDILALLVLSLVQNFPSGVTATALAPFIGVLALACLFIVAGIIFGKEFVRRVLDSKKEEIISNQTLLAVLSLVLFYAYVAEFIGLSAIVGAFIAGISINYSKKIKEFIEKTEVLEAFFTPMFFLSLGLLVNITALFDNFTAVVIVTIIAALTKLFGCGVTARISGLNFRDSFRVGIGMIPRGEIALIIGLIGVTTIGMDGNPILGAGEYAVISAMAFLTTIIVPSLLKKTIARS